MVAVSPPDDRPLDEHVAVFERAHDPLRRALDDPPAPGRGRAPVPLDASGSTPELVRRGLARSREHAAELIAAGRVTGVRRTATKPATGVTTDVALVVDDGPDRPRLRLPRRPQARGRAGRVRRRARSSTAGAASTPAPRPAASPTSCCAAGAARCVAVDVGYGQLAWSLRSDDRGRGARPHQRPRADPRRWSASRSTWSSATCRSSRSRWCCPRWSVTRRGRRPRADGQAAVRGGQGPGRQGRGGARPALRAEAVVSDRRARPPQRGWGARGGDRQPAARAVGQRGVLPLAAPRAATLDADDDRAGGHRPCRRWGRRVRGWIRDRPRSRTPGAACSPTPVAGRGARGRPHVRAPARPRTASRSDCWPTRPRPRRAGRRRQPGRAHRLRGDAAADCELVLVIGGDGHDPARRRGHPRDAAPRCWGSTSVTSGSSPRPSPRTSLSTIERDRGAATTPSRTGSPSTCASLEDGRAWSADLGAQRGQRGEGRPRADARGRASRSTAARCRAGAATGWSARPRPARPPTTSAPVARSSGPSVEALLLVPISAHALFARPMVVAPTSVHRRRGAGATDGSGVLWCDGRRTVDLPPVPASRYAAATGRCGWHGCTRHRSPTGWSPSSACPSRAGAAPPSAAAAACRAPARRADDRGDPDQLAGRHRLLGARARARPDRHHR